MEMHYEETEVMNFEEIIQVDLWEYYFELTKEMHFGKIKPEEIEILEAETN